MTLKIEKKVLFFATLIMPSYRYYLVSFRARTRYVPGPTHRVDNVMVAVPVEFAALFDDVRTITRDDESLSMQRCTPDEDDTIYVPPSTWLRTFREIHNDESVCYDHLWYLHERISVTAEIKHVFVDDEADEN